MQKLLSRITRRREPMEFMLWLTLLGITLMFFFLIVIFLRYRYALPELRFEVPRIFELSTFFILVSSLTLEQAHKAFQKEEFFAYRYLLGTTLVIALAFVVCQWIGWQHMYEANRALIQGTPLDALFYLITGLHLLHLLVGIVILLYYFIIALLKAKYIDAFIYAMNPPTQLFLRLFIIYWHFIGILWLVLFIIFLII